MCILHSITAMRRLVVHFLEALCSNLDKVLRVGVQPVWDVRDGARTGMRLGSAASPDGEEVYRVLQTLEHV